MPRPAPPDLSGLAAAAQTAGPELRGLLLRIGARSFVDGRGRDPGAAARFESLALGLIPLATSDVLAEAAAILRRAPDAPASVVRLLAERLDLDETDPDLARAGAPGLSPWEAHGLATLARPAVDGALARNGAVTLDGPALAALVGRARGDRDLARLLLARTELTAADRAALYRHADAAERARLRSAFTAAWRSGGGLRPGCEASLVAAVEAAAGNGDAAGLWAAVGRGLGLPPDEAAPDVDDPAGAELLALALRATGLDPDRCLGALLKLDAPFARSAPAVFALAEIVRATPAAAARRLLGAPEGHAAAGPTADGAPGGRARAGARGRLSLAPAFPAGAGGASGLPDRRSRSATGRGRT